MENNIPEKIQPESHKRHKYLSEDGTTVNCVKLETDPVIDVVETSVESIIRRLASGQNITQTKPIFDSENPLTKEEEELLLNSNNDDNLIDAVDAEQMLITYNDSIKQGKHKIELLKAKKNTLENKINEYQKEKNKFVDSKSETESSKSSE